VLGPEPAIDPREVARLAREAFVRDPTLSEEALYAWVENLLRYEAAYLASHGIPSAEDPRDAEMRGLQDCILTQQASVVRAMREAEQWRLMCEKIQHRIREIQEAPKPAEPTRTERLARFARDAKALKLDPLVSTTGKFFPMEYAILLDDAEAAAVRAALEEKADAT
jgi:hypothetical protein